MSSLILFAALLCGQATQEKAWYPLSNYPAWEGYGMPYDAPSGPRIKPERFRLVADRSVELLPDGQPAPPSPPGQLVPMVDPFGFTAWLNSIRAQSGLAAVGYDAALESCAHQNNLLQASYGLGHHFMGIARRQNAGMGPASVVWSAWTHSPGHAAALFDPTIRAVGIAVYGSWWTFSAY
jgi:hypothetical protein